MRGDSGDEPPDWVASLAAQRPGRADTTPAGVSLFRSLILPPGTLPHDQALRDLLEAIEAVHGDGVLPPTPVRWGKLRPDLVARYQATEDLAHAVSLTVDPSQPRWRLALDHEVGHFLDLQGVQPADTFASVADVRLTEWRAATLASDAVRQLLAALGADAYLTQPEELWARSYAQWIAIRSRHIDLWADIVESRGTNRAAARYFRQWGEQDIEPIAVAIDRLFRSLGWMV